ncbi:hypothetical protein FKM82_002048 [Ascaphus truei]
MHTMLTRISPYICTLYLYQLKSKIKRHNLFIRNKHTVCYTAPDDPETQTGKISTKSSGLEYVKHTWLRKK